MMSPNTVRRLLATRIAPPPEPEPQPARGQYLLDRLEARIWISYDARMLAAGWEVVRLGRWQRQYRHPDLLARAMAASRAGITQEEAARPVAARPGRLLLRVHPVSVGRLRRHATVLPGKVTSSPTPWHPDQARLAARAERVA